MVTQTRGVHAAGRAAHPQSGEWSDWDFLHTLKSVTIKVLSVDLTGCAIVECLIKNARGRCA